MSEKIRVLRVERPGYGATFSELDGAQAELEALVDEDEVGQRLVIELVEMTVDEYEALPEFEGW